MAQNNAVLRYDLPFTTIFVYRQENGSARVVLNGILLGQIFTGEDEEIKICALNMVFGIYAQVLKMIEPIVIGVENEKECTNNLCKDGKPATDQVPVQSEDRPLDDADLGDGKLRFLRPSDDRID